MTDPRLVRKVPLHYKEYVHYVCIGETDRYYLANAVDCEGIRSYQVWALTKDIWQLQPEKGA